MERTSLTNEGIESIRQKSLESLKWSSKFTTEDSLSSIANLSNLTYLGIDQRLKTDEGLGKLTSLEKLRQFTFQNNSDQLIDSFKTKVTQIVNLNVFRCPLILNGENLFQYISSLKNLQTLSVHHVPNITPSCWSSLIKLSELRVLKVGNSGLIDSNAVSNILRISSLRILEFSDPEIDEDSLDGLAHLPYLTNLSIIEKDSHYMTSRHLQPLSFLENLTHLTIAGCKNISDFSSLSRCLKLSYLNASNTGITDVFSNSLSEIESLSVLRLENNNISNITIHNLSSLSNLTELNVSGCSKVSFTFQNISTIIKNKGLLYLHDIF